MVKVRGQQRARQEFAAASGNMNGGLEWSECPVAISDRCTDTVTRRREVGNSIVIEVGGDKQWRDDRVDRHDMYRARCPAGLRELRRRYPALSPFFANQSAHPSRRRGYSQRHSRDMSVSLLGATRTNVGQVLSVVEILSEGTVAASQADEEL